MNSQLHLAFCHYRKKGRAAIILMSNGKGIDRLVMMETLLGVIFATDFAMSFKAALKDHLWFRDFYF